MLAGLLAAATIATSAPSTDEAVITRPDWLEKPSAEAVSEAYPRAAAEAGVAGRASVRCFVMVTGLLTNCRVVEETPKGHGFGEAALTLAERFRMRPLLVDGKPEPGGAVTIPIAFTPPPMIPGLELATRCYGWESAKAEADPTDAAAWERAARFLMIMSVHGWKAGLPPSRIEALAARARAMAAAVPDTPESREERRGCAAGYAWGRAD